MNIQEMHIGVRLSLQGIDANRRDGYEPEEIDYYLNKGIREFVRSQYALLKTPRKEDPESQDATENLRTLIISVNFQKDDLKQSQKIPGAMQVELPVPPGEAVGEGETVIRAVYEYFIHGHALYEQHNCDSHRPLVFSNIAALRRYMQSQTSSSSAWHKELPIFILNNEIHVLKEFDEDEIKNMIIFYLRPFRRVNITDDVDSDLPEQTHEIIIDIAVDLMMRDINQQRGPQNQQQARE